MGYIHVLDCTLRDGGYCNDWAFGKDNIVKTVSGLTDAGIDIIECGFISSKVELDWNRTKYPSVESVSSTIPCNRKDASFVAMINYGEFDCSTIPPRTSDTIDGIRVAFHKKNVVDALRMCEIIKEKGYDVYVQAMVSMNYSDEEFLDLIKKVNGLRPFAFYIVDSFGMMKKRDLIRFFSLVEHNLHSNINIGFHSHNNLQLAYSNSLALLDVRSGRNLIIDTSVCGMGRGAGNLNTELFIDHLNEEFGSGYLLSPILTIMDEVVNDFYLKAPWGYSLPNYLSAIHNAHPNYAGYFSDKNTLTIEAMNELFSCIDAEKRTEYSKEYAETMYIQYMNAGAEHTQHLGELTEMISGKTVLLIAPGKSSDDEKDKIIEYSKRDDVISVGINSPFAHRETDLIFVSNLRRYHEIPHSERNVCITTSNISSKDSFLQLKYHDLLNDDEIVKDNAGLMAIKLFMNHGVKKIVLAGFDGYSYDLSENNADNRKTHIYKKAIIDATNYGMSSVLKEFSKEIEIIFLTSPRHYSL